MVHKVRTDKLYTNWTFPLHTGVGDEQARACLGAGGRLHMCSRHLFFLNASAGEGTAVAATTFTHSLAHARLPGDTGDRKSAYLLADGGYVNYPELQAPFKVPCGSDEVAYHQQQVSVRKGKCAALVGMLSFKQGPPSPCAATDLVRTCVRLVCTGIECVFGLMKKRWRILMTPMLFRDKRTLDNVFMTCSAW